MILPDLLQPNLKLIFCGTAASTISAREVAYYANPTNYFWRTLYAVGLTPRQLAPKDFPTLVNFGIGLTDIAKHATGNDADLKKSDYDVQSLHAKILKFQPHILAFTSKKGASEFFTIPTRKIQYGAQKQQIGTTNVWVLTSPSGSARSYWDQSIWQALSDQVGKLPEC